MGCELAFFSGLALSGLFVPGTRLPAQARPASLLGPTFLIVVLRIVRTPLPVHLALETTDGLFIRVQLCAQRLQPGFCFPWDDGDASRTQVEADGVVAYGMLRLLVGHPFQDQLHAVAISLAVSAVCSWAGS